MRNLIKRISALLLCLLLVLSLPVTALAEEAKDTDEAAAAAKTLRAKQTQEEQASADPEIDALVAARTEAKKAKNFAEADRIRDELKARGIEIIDTPQGAKWRKV